MGAPKGRLVRVPDAATDLAAAAAAVFAAAAAAVVEVLVPGTEAGVVSAGPPAALATLRAGLEQAAATRATMATTANVRTALPRTGSPPTGGRTRRRHPITDCLEIAAPRDPSQSLLGLVVRRQSPLLLPAAHRAGGPGRRLNSLNSSFRG